MVIDFLNLDQKEQPVLVLRNLDGTAIQTLGYAFNIEGEFCYSEISTLTFDIPAYANGMSTPHYKDIIGTRIVDLVGWGQFILVDPEIKKDGITEIKHCKAYSLEYELTYKQMTLPEYGYYLRHVDEQRSLMDIVKSYIPSWSINVDVDLSGAYRYFSENRVNVYNFLKSTVQKEYNCIVDFDTYTRTINVIPAGKDVPTKKVFLSAENLAKDLTISEDTENIFTVLDVNGADGVDIRRVNPMGENKIYNLDYFMNSSHFSDGIIKTYKDWKTNFNEKQKEYYDLAISRLIKTGQITIAQYEKSKLEAELAQEKVKRATAIEAIAVMTDTTSSSYQNLNNELAKIKATIDKYEGEGGKLNAQQDVIDDLSEEKDALTDQMKAIVDASKLETFFGDDYLIIDRYFKEDSIEDSSFVLSQVATLDNLTASSKLENVAVSVPEPPENNLSCRATVTMTKLLTGKEVYTIVGGKLNTSDVDANIVRITLEYDSSADTFVLVGYLNKGTINGNSFDSGTITVSGSCSAVTHDAKESETISGIYENGTSLSFNVTNAQLYFTKDKSEYEEFTVCWDLYEYGMKCLNKLAYPSYTFKLTTANFLTLDAFRSFALELELGKKVYIERAEGDIMEPILTKVWIKFEDPSSLQLDFSDTYSAADSKFSLVDLLDKSISLGKTVDAGKYSYNSFVSSGASSKLSEFINGVLDASKNNILSGSNQEISWDETGMHFRKWNKDESAYDPHEIGVVNNNIVFTDDGWATAKMAIGELVYKKDDDTEQKMWGVAAPALIGKALIGENLTISTGSDQNGNIYFSVDQNGASLYNAKFEIYDDNRHIILSPDHGLAIGGTSIITTDENGKEILDEEKLNFHVDTDGNVTFRGILNGVHGHFDGTVSFAEDDGYVALNGTKVSDDKDYSEFAFWAGSEDPNNAPFWVKKDGKMKASGATFSGDISGSTGTFSGTVTAANVLVGETSLMDGNQINSDFVDLSGITLVWDDITGRPNIPEVPKYIADGGIDFTLIDDNTVETPYIKSNAIDLLGGYFRVQSSGAQTRGYIGQAYGLDGTKDEDGNYQLTYGVALSSGDPTQLGSSTQYVIVTNKGVRLQSGNSSMYIVDSGCWVSNVGSTPVRVGTCVFG